MELFFSLIISIEYFVNIYIGHVALLQSKIAKLCMFTVQVYCVNITFRFRESLLTMRIIENAAKVFPFINDLWLNQQQMSLIIYKDQTCKNLSSVKVQLRLFWART